MFREGTALDSLEIVDSRRFLPHALIATLLTVVAPALVVVALTPLSGLADLLLSALLATGLSVVAASAGAALWTRLPPSREIPFSDLMLWSWARRVRSERRLARVQSGVAPLGGEQGLAALRRLNVVFEARDGLSYGHSDRVARHAERIARRLGLPDAEVERIEAAAAVHDVGMMGVPRAVLARDGELTPDERALVQSHAIRGADKVAAVADPETAALVRHHHERFDGGGYPDGLTGDEIPLGARIVAVADSFDELTSPGPQRSPHGRRNALDELSARAGSELDPTVVAAFVAYYSGTRAIAGVALAATAPQRAVRWIAAAPASIGAAVGAPVALQGFCAAGTAALAGACLAGLPALSPDRDGERPAAERRAAQDAASGAGGTAVGPLAAADPAAAGDGRRGRSGPAPGRDGDGNAPGPPSRTPQDVPTSGDGGGGSAPTSPAAPPAGGPGGEPAPGGGGSEPGSPTVAQPAAPASPPQQVEVPSLPANPTSQVVDPILDGVSETVPQVAPLTEAVKGLVGGLAGGLSGAGR